MVKMESLGKLVGGLRAKFLRDEIELLKKRAGGQASGHIHTSIVVLEDQLYVLEGIGLDDDAFPLSDVEKPDYNHKFDIAFCVISQKEDPYKVLPSELRAALITRIAEIDVEKGWEEAVGFCDSYEVVKKND